jgi:hypothetical protein
MNNQNEIRDNTYQTVNRQTHSPLVDIPAAEVTSDGLPYVMLDDRPTWLVIKAADRKMFEQKGWTCRGVVSVNAKAVPLLRMAPPPSKPAIPTEFDDSQTYTEFLHKVRAVLEEGLRLGVPKEHVKVIAQRAVAAF